MSAPRHGDQVHVAARFMRIPPGRSGVVVRINTPAGVVDVKVSLGALLTTEGKRIEWSPPCNSLLLIEDERFYLRCELPGHPEGKHWAHYSPSDVEWDDDDPNAVRIEI